MTVARLLGECLRELSIRTPLAATSMMGQESTRKEIKQMSGWEGRLPCEYVGDSPPVEARGSRLFLRSVVLLAFCHSKHPSVFP